MADKNVTFHPYTAQGTMDTGTNLYPKTKAENVMGLPEGETDIEFTADNNGVLQKIDVGDETYTIPQGGGGGGTQLYRHKLSIPREWDYGTQTFIVNIITTVNTQYSSSYGITSALRQGKIISINCVGNEDGPATQQGTTAVSVDSTGFIEFFIKNSSLSTMSWQAGGTVPYDQYVIEEL